MPGKSPKAFLKPASPFSAKPSSEVGRNSTVLSSRARKKSQGYTSTVDFSPGSCAGKIDRSTSTSSISPMSRIAVRGASERKSTTSFFSGSTRRCISEEELSCNRAILMGKKRTNEESSGIDYGNITSTTTTPTATSIETKNAAETTLGSAVHPGTTTSSRLAPSPDISHSDMDIESMSEASTPEREEFQKYISEDNWSDPEEERNVTDSPGVGSLVADLSSIGFNLGVQKALIEVAWQVRKVGSRSV